MHFGRLYPTSTGWGQTHRTFRPKSWVRTLPQLEVKIGGGGYRHLRRIQRPKDKTSLKTGCFQKNHVQKCNPPRFFFAPLQVIDTNNGAGVGFEPTGKLCYFN